MNNTPTAWQAQSRIDTPLGPLTLVMKGESIPANSHWHGCPAAPAG